MTKHTLNAIALGLLSVFAVACGDAGAAFEDEDLSGPGPLCLRCLGRPHDWVRLDRLRDLWKDGAACPSF